MATARPGWSRRAQYGLFFSFLAVIAGIIVGLVLLALSLVAPPAFDARPRCRARRHRTGRRRPCMKSPRPPRASVTGAGNYWDAASQNAELKRERKAMLQRMVEAKAIFQENQQLKATLQLRERERTTDRHRAHRRLLVQQSAPLRDPVGRDQRRRAHRDAGPLARRPGRPDHRRRRPRLARAARFRPREHRSRAAASQRHSGDRAGPRRRDHRRPPARSRPQPVQARRHHHHLRHRRPVSAAGADRPGREAR